VFRENLENAAKFRLTLMDQQGVKGF
jgi:hypothetical protein